MKKLIVCLLLCCSTIPAFAQEIAKPSTPAQLPAVDPAEREAVVRLLRVIHDLPPRESFEEATANPVSVLRELASGNGPIAERAVMALFMWPNDQTFELVMDMLSDVNTPDGRRHRLLVHLATSYGERATDVVVAHLQHADAQMRITAASAVAKIRTEKAFEALDAAIAAEENAAVARAMQRYARRIR